MPKVIKIIVSDKFFEEHIAGDIESLTTQNVGIAEGMVRMLIGGHFKDSEEIELNTDDVTDERMTKVIIRSIRGCLTAKLLQGHGEED